jgi:hypothetical protein
MLNEKGQCCGRKPLVYKSRHTTSTGPHRFCPRCDAAYDLDENKQILNWAWKNVNGKWLRNTNKLVTAVEGDF